AYDPQRYWIRTMHAGNLNLSYDQYDSVGNVGQIGDSRTGMTQTFSYDVLDRLKVASGPYGQVSYDYDVHGNRQGAAFVYEAATLRLQSQNGETFTYDNNGNLTTAANRIYTYTPRNLMAGATVGGATIAYDYDADDLRVKKTRGGETSYYLRGANGELLTEWINP